QVVFLSKERSKISTLKIKKPVRLSSPKGYRLFFLILSLQNFFRLDMLFSPSRQTKRKIMVIDLDKQVYEPNRLD
ncbi:hypothetical protein, partial [Bacillus pseudomycoides]|uniref:hypothetical protein n=1 Tax=Bacillus pseudomycoides TaxID=64104 RepID=UPI001C54CF63